MTDSKPPKAPASKAPAAPKATTPPAPPAPPAPQPYAPQPSGGVAYQPGMAPPTNTLAIIALVLGFVVPLGGIICGHIALGQIKRTGESGHGLALAGAIIGYVLTGLGLLFLIFYVIFFAALFSSGVLTPGTVI